MIENVQTEYKAYVAAIETSKNCGTGFFIAPELICTCYHVIADSDMSDISVRWKDRILQVQDCSRYEDKDLVFLQTKDANNDGWLSFAPIDAVKEGMQFRAFGFPENHRDYGSPFLLTYTGADVNNQILSFSQDNITPGASGSPIVSSNTNSLLGMLSVSRDVQTPSGGRGLSANCILKCLCEDPKFYSYAIRMLQTNDAFLIDDCQWASDDSNIADACLRYFRTELRRNPEYHLFSIVRPYIRLVLDGAIPDNPYLATAKLFVEKHGELIPLFMKWLIRYKDGKDSSFINSAIIYLKNGILPLDQSSIKSVESFCVKLKFTRIAGSSYMRVSDLFARSGQLKVPFTWRSDDFLPEYSEVEQSVIAQLENNQSCMILADPGVGKSTFSKALLFNLIELRSKNESRLIPIYVDLQHELLMREHTFGEEWLSKKIALQYGGLSNIYLGASNENIVFILDGLDEYLDNLSKSEVESFFATDLFAYGNKFKMVVTCRVQFFERRLAGFYSALESFSQIVILPWNKEQKREYIQQYIKLLKQKNHALAITDGDDVLRQLTDSPFLCEVSGTPLYLNMTLEVLCSGNRKKISNIVDLYDQYSYNWVNNEVKRVSQSTYFEDIFGIDIEVLLSAVGAVAWKYHEFTYSDRFSDHCYRSFSRQEIAKLLCEISDELMLPSSQPSYINKLAKFITNHTFFVFVQASNLKFIHKSFYEYFAARYTFETLLKSKTNDSLIIKLHSVLFSPEISELIKEHIARIDYVPAQKNKFLDNAIRSIEKIGNNQEKSWSPAKRIARQQLIYHIGLIELGRSSEYLKSLLYEESDLWIKRGIIIGLSFSGDSFELDRYIDRMRMELSKDPPRKENEVNIGFSLSFFGDQPYDNYHPEIDQQLPKCQNTVKRLIYQLSTNVDRPSWRSNLYTLVYLANYRPVSKCEYDAAIRSKSGELRKILDDISASGISWPEINDMRRIIDEICSEG